MQQHYRIKRSYAYESCDTALLLGPVSGLHSHAGISGVPLLLVCMRGQLILTPSHSSSPLS